MRAKKAIYLLHFILLLGSSLFASPGLPVTACTYKTGFDSHRIISHKKELQHHFVAASSMASYASFERKHSKSFHKKCLVVKEFVLFTFSARPPACSFISRKYGYLPSALQGRDIVFSPLRGPPAIG